MKKLLFVVSSIVINCGYASAAISAIDYDDGLVNGIHDSVIGNGEFTDSTANTSNGWVSLIGTPLFNDGDAPNAPTGSAINYEAEGGDSLVRNTGFTILAGDTVTVNMSFQWIRRLNFDDADTVRMVVYTTVDNLIGGIDLETVEIASAGTDSGINNANAAWIEVSASGQSLAGNDLLDRTVFVRLENAAGGLTPGLARFDNIFVSVPEPSSLSLLMIGSLGVLRRKRV